MTTFALERLTLRTTLTFLLLIPVSVLVAALIITLTNLARNALEQRLTGEIDLIARAVAPVISGRLERWDRAGLQESLDAVFSIGRVYGAAVYDASGTPVARAGLTDSDLTDSRLANAAVVSGEGEGRYRQVGERPVYSSFSPLFDRGGQILGLLQINRSRQEIDARLDDFRRFAWFSWGIGLCFVALLVVTAGRRLIARPVEDLLVGIASLGRGERAVRVSDHHAREFHQLASAFNGMVESLEGLEAEREAIRLRELSLMNELQASERIAELGRMAAGIAHELGAPLTVIQGRTRRLLDVLDDPAEIERTRSILRESERLQAIVRQLLDYCRSGQGDPERRDVAADALVRGVLTNLSEEIDGAAVEVTTGTLDPCPVRVDRVRLETALANLIRNALRHARTRVRVGVEAQGGVLRLIVEDDGDGVAEDDRPRLFEPFFTRQRSGRGTGLGLAIVAQVAEEHGGRAAHEPVTPHGSRFVISLPGEPGA